MQGAGVVEKALSEIGVKTRAAGALRFEMVGDDDQLFAIGKHLEFLRDRGAGVDESRVARGSRQAHRGHLGGFVDDGGLDGVGAAVKRAPASRVAHECPDTRARRGVQAIHQILHGRIHTNAIVLDFHQGHDVGIQT